VQGGGKPSYIRAVVLLYCHAALTVPVATMQQLVRRKQFSKLHNKYATPRQCTTESQHGLVAVFARLLSRMDYCASLYQWQQQAHWPNA
jgi:hypothetical protein